MRSLVGRMSAELMRVRLAVSGGRVSGTLDGMVEIHGLRSELERTSDALAHAADALRAAEEQAAELAATVRRQDELLRRKEMLTQEVHHRVKNGFQAIVALMRMEAAQQRLEPLAEFLLRSCARIDALAAVHGMLHAEQRTDALDVTAYIRAICASLARALAPTGRSGRSWSRSSPWSSGRKGPRRLRSW
ncbi:histidine kinase dimerization/phosphoacceptor domain -containing protein [Arenibaculum pallidiluteum]|uniref:histidine kinase dimerization/phosphoacceptor domain -containing protein n=1 Tax=Arenibaculum pallidiluteum TaxID=2812559 RepID=UPI001A974A2A|nr:histidine kinase dimerization/phosphoacceptor domain -containing protein [Arenibaculum pallidiluteum]